MQGAHVAADESDETLSGRAAAGCRAAFSALVARHYDLIYRLAWRWCGDRATAEDIAQDVCVKLAKAIGGYRGEARFSTWLYRIAYTTALDHIRAAQRTVVLEPSDILSLVDQNDFVPPEDCSEGAELWTAVRSLPNQQRDAVLLVYGEDMSHAEAARVMNCSEKTVSWHVHEAKKRLKILLDAVG